MAPNIALSILIITMTWYPYFSVLFRYISPFFFSARKMLNLQISDRGLYRCPVLRCLLVITAACSLFSVFFPLGVLRVLSFHSLWSWMVCSLLLYCCRPLEHRLGSRNLVVIVLSSCLLAGGLLLGVVLSQQYPPMLPNGFVMYCVLVCVLGHMLLLVRSPYSLTLCGVKLSSHLLLMLLALTCITSRSAIFSSLCGLIGTITVYALGPLPLPALLVNGIMRLTTLLPEDKQPRLLSGATLAVQRQQRVNLIEALMIELQTRQGQQQMRVFAPSDVLVQMLTGMGFQADQARQALIAANGDITRAVQILTTLQH